MRLSYRQGLVAAQSGFLQLNGNNGVDLVISPTPVLATVASGPVDYLFGEYKNVTSAWGPFPISNTIQYLYWQLNQFTGAVTRGATTLAPIIAATAPSSPQVGQTWWDSTHLMMNIWNGSVWTPTLLVFAGTLQGSTLTAEPFISQVGLNTPVEAGYILTDGFGGVFRDNNGAILTTETPVISNDTGSLVKLDGAQFIVQASEALPAFSLVYIINGYAALASSVPPFNVTNAPMAMVGAATPQNGPASLIAGGKQVFNQQWSWTPSQQGLPVYCDGEGNVTLNQPGTNQFVQVGIITGPQSILLTFNQITIEASGAGSGSGAVSEVLSVAPITITGTTAFPVVSMPQVSNSNAGYLDSADYTTFTGYAATIASKVDSTYSGWSIAQVVGLQAELDTFVTDAQNWPISQITGLSAQLATYVTASQTWPISQITGLQGQLNTINTQLNNKINTVVGTTGDLTMISAGGQIADAGISVTSINNKANKVSTAIVGDFASLTSSGDIADSGLNAGSFATPANIASLQSQINTTNTAVAAKVDMVPSALIGDFASFSVGGDIADSGYNAASFAPAAPTSTAITNLNNDVTAINTELSMKVDLVPSAVSGNFASFVSGGDIADSGLNASSFIATGTQLPQSQIIGLTTSLNAKVNKSGDTMTGTLALPSINIGGNILVDATGALTAGGSVGSVGQVLTSAGAGVPPTWSSVSSGGGNSSTVTITPVSNHQNYFLTFVAGDSGQQAFYAADQSVAPSYYSPATNTLSIANFAGSLTGNASSATVATNVIGPTNGILYQSGTNQTATDSRFTYDPVAEVLTISRILTSQTLADGSGGQLLIAPGHGTGAVGTTAGDLYLGTYDQTGGISSGNIVLTTGASTGGSSGFIDLQIADVSLFKVGGDRAIYLSGSAGTAGQVLTTQGPGTAPTWTTVSGGGSPAGSSGQIQFNNGGAFAADAGFAWDNTNKALVLGNATANEYTYITDTSTGTVGSPTATDTSTGIAISGTSSGVAGGMSITGGNGVAQGGNVSISGGTTSNTSTVSGPSGSVNITGGTNNGVGQGGVINIVGGASYGSGNSANGGDVNINGGNVYNNSYPTAGNINLTTGVSNDGNGPQQGSIYFYTTSNPYSAPAAAFQIDPWGTLLVQSNAGTSGQVLQSNGAQSPPSWTTPIPSVVKASLPTALYDGQQIYVSDATGAHVTGSLCFWNSNVPAWIDVTTGVAVA